jgi:hypothetical protein
MFKEQSNDRIHSKWMVKCITSGKVVYFNLFLLNKATKHVDYDMKIHLIFHF